MLTLQVNFADKSSFPPNGVATLASVILPISSSSACSSLPATLDLELASDLAETDLDLLTTSASLLETLSVDLDLAKLDLAFARYPSSASASALSPTDTLLARLFDFVEHAAPPAYWAGVGESGSGFGDKEFATVKSAVMRAVVEAPNSDEVMNRLFAGEGRSWVVEKLVGWVGSPTEGREDLLICAAHMLAALGRKGGHSRGRLVNCVRAPLTARDDLQTSTASCWCSPTAWPPPWPRSPPLTPGSSLSRPRRGRGRRLRFYTG